MLPTMDWQMQLELVGRVALAAFWGGVIGWQRERRGHSAGVRTFAAVAAGSSAFAVAGAYASPGGDHTRIAAQVVTGIGFVGAGVIMHQGERNQRLTAKGLTTAATLWAAAAVGVADGFGLHLLSGGTALLLTMLLWLGETDAWKQISPARRLERERQLQRAQKEARKQAKLFESGIDLDTPSNRLARGDGEDSSFEMGGDGGRGSPDADSGMASSVRNSSSSSSSLQEKPWRATSIKRS